MATVLEIIEKKLFSAEHLEQLLLATGEDANLLFTKAAEVKHQVVGNKVYFRGLIELSNVCEKDCLYCGIRKSNELLTRYNLSDEEVLEAAMLALKENYGSIVIQSGETTNKAFVSRIEMLVSQIKEMSDGKLGITLSLGEQTRETYSRWFAAGAHRYLMRIESSNPELYARLHPQDKNHLFENRLKALYLLKETGFQTGTGVMIGAPSQTVNDLANDLLFFKKFEIDMVGMGPYIEHDDTPLGKIKAEVPALTERFNLTLKMIAALRLLMPDINIAATTAMQAIDPLGREKAVKVGANIIMPNITPAKYRGNYLLYNNKPCTSEEPGQCTGCLDARLALTDSEIGYGEWGDSKHYQSRN